ARTWRVSGAPAYVSAPGPRLRGPLGDDEIGRDAAVAGVIGVTHDVEPVRHGLDRGDAHRAAAGAAHLCVGPGRDAGKRVGHYHRRPPPDTRRTISSSTTAPSVALMISRM